MNDEPQHFGPVKPVDGSQRPATLHRIFLSATDDRLRPIFRVLLFVLFGSLLLLASQLAVLRLGRGLTLGQQFAVAYVLVIPVLLAVTWFFIRAFDRRSFRTLGLWFYPRWGRELAAGVGIGAALQLFVGLALVTARGVSYHGITLGVKQALVGILATGGLLVLAAAFEEIAFRGYGFQRLVEAVGPLGAVAVFSVLFGVTHRSNPSATPLSTINTVLAGVLLSVAYLKTRALWLPIGLHWAWNFTMGAILSLPVSGIRLGPTLLKVETTRAIWLTGGAYGPEGGVVVTAACLVTIVWLARTRRLAPSPAMEEVLK